MQYPAARSMFILNEIFDLARQLTAGSMLISASKLRAAI
jgi:hypothetical protein